MSKKPWRPKKPLDLRKYIEPGKGLKFYCWFCCTRYTEHDVWKWWSIKRKVPKCPLCGLAGAELGWHENQKVRRVWKNAND